MNRDILEKSVTLVVTLGIICLVVIIGLLIKVYGIEAFAIFIIILAVLTILITLYKLIDLILWGHKDD